MPSALPSPPSPAPLPPCSPTKELSIQTARVLKLLLPGLRIRCSVLSKATAAGTDFSKARAALGWLPVLLAGGQLHFSWSPSRLSTQALDCC